MSRSPLSLAAALAALLPLGCDPAESSESVTERRARLSDQRPDTSADLSADLSADSSGELADADAEPSAGTDLSDAEPSDAEPSDAEEPQRETPQARIVGGGAANIQDHPWQVSLQVYGQHFCGGSVLSARWVLTAQHCIEDFGEGKPPSDFKVVGGVSKLSDRTGSQRQERGVARVIPYAGYDDPSNGKDVALLELSAPLDLSRTNVRAIGIVGAADAQAGLTEPGRLSLVSGWGALKEGGGTPDRLQAVVVPIVSLADAQAAYRRGDPSIRLTSDQLPAGVLGIGGKDSCQGDSGGPLVVSDDTGAWRLAGVVSWGFGCADPDYPGLYARVSSFEAWIARESGVTPPVSAPVPEPTPEPEPDPAPDPTPEPEPDPVGAPRLVINELFADPAPGYDANGDGVASTTQDEFIEIANVGTATADLSGVALRDAFGVRFTFPAGTSLAPGEVAVVFGGGKVAGLPFLAFASKTLGLNNDGDTATLLSADGQVLDQFEYRSGATDQSWVRYVDGDPAAFFVPHLELSTLAASPGRLSSGGAW